MASASLFDGSFSFAGFIGTIPPPPTSTFIGERWLQACPSSKHIVSVMFRCQTASPLHEGLGQLRFPRWQKPHCQSSQSPPNGGSQHVLLHLKSSVTEESHASKLYQIFEILRNGSVIMEMMLRFVPGQCPLTDPHRGTVLLRSGRRRPVKENEDGRKKGVYEQ